MNESEHVNPKDCRSCGECCKHFSIWYDRKNDPLVFSEVQRFKLLQADISVIEHKDWVEVRFNYPCKHLKYERFRYTCEIYDSPERPMLCAHFPFANSTPEDCRHFRKN